MKSFLKVGLTAIIFVLFFSAFNVTETRAQAQVLQEILNRMDKHNQALQTLRSDVTMVKHNTQLGEDDTNVGSVTYRPSKGRDAYVRIDWTKPSEEVLSVVNGQYVLYRPRLNQAITGDAKKAQGNGKASSALAFMNMSKAQLKNNYSIKFLGQEKLSNGTETAHLELTPKTASAYKSAEIWVDADGMPVQARIVENNKDTTTVMLSNIKKNVTINNADFAVKLPKNVKIIKG